MTGLLRGVAGELADLVEAALPGGRGPEEGGTPQSKGETLGRTPGPEKEAAVKEEQFSASQYSYSEGEEEEPAEEEAAVEEGPEKVKEETIEAVPREEPRKRGPPEVDGAGGDRSRGPPKAEQEERASYKVNPKFNPRYLTERLHLFPTGKASAVPRRAGGECGHSSKRGAEQGPGGGDHHGGDGAERGSRRHRGQERPASPERPPLPRRYPADNPERKPRGPKTKKKKKNKKNKGVKRRERGRTFRTGREDRKGDRRRW